MTTTLAKNHTTVSDGWSRDEDGLIRMTERQLDRLFQSLKKHGRKSIGYAANFELSRGATKDDFKRENDIECLGGA